MISRTMPELTLFDFIKPSETRHWRPSDDALVGGESFSELQPVAESVAIFQGEVSVQNDERGFASVITAPARYNLAEYDGLAIRVRGEGKVYGFYLRSGRLVRQNVRYQAMFYTPPGEWSTVRIPFDVFEPMVWGMRLPIGPPLDRGDITGFGFIIGDKQAGPFSLEIDWIKAYRNGGKWLA